MFFDFNLSGSAPTRCGASPCFALAIHMCSFPLLCYPVQFRCNSKQFVAYLIRFCSMLRLSGSWPVCTVPHRFCSNPSSSSATLVYALPFLFQSTLFPFGSHLFGSISGPVASIPLPIPALRFLVKANRGISTLSHVVSIHFTALGFVALGSIPSRIKSFRS